MDTKAWSPKDSPTMLAHGQQKYIQAAAAGDPVAQALALVQQTLDQYPQYLGSGSNLIAAVLLLQDLQEDTK